MEWSDRGQPHRVELVDTLDHVVEVPEVGLQDAVDVVVEVQDLVDDVEGLLGRPGVGLEADGVDGCRPRDEIHCHGNELVPGDEGVQVGP